MKLQNINKLLSFHTQGLVRRTHVEKQLDVFLKSRVLVSHTRSYKDYYDDHLISGNFRGLRKKIITQQNFVLIAPKVSQNA